MAWLVRDGTVLASLEVLDTRTKRAKGLLGETSVDGAVMLPKTRSVHSFGMRMEIDVAFCNDDMEVVRVLRLKRFRVTRPAMKAACVIEAEAGAFAHWELTVGDCLEIR